MSETVERYTPGGHCRIFTVITRQEGGEGGGMRIIASDASVDRMGDIVEQTWQLDNFNRNPVLLWSHDPSQGAIGRAENVRIEDIDGKPALTFEPKWDTGDHNPLGTKIAAQFANGMLNAVSVGFRPGAVTPRSSLDEHDPRHANTGLILSQNELLEISPVTIPANANALAIRAVTDPADALVARAIEEAVKAALEAVPALVAEAVKAALPAEVLTIVRTDPEIRKAIQGHLDAMPDGSGSTVEAWLAKAKILEDSDNVTSIVDWLGQAERG